MKIGQLSFVQLSEPAETPYGAGSLGSKYQGQKGPTPSRYWKNFEMILRHWRHRFRRLSDRPCAAGGGPACARARS